MVAVNRFRGRDFGGNKFKKCDCGSSYPSSPQYNMKNQFLFHACARCKASKLERHQRELTRKGLTDQWSK